MVSRFGVALFASVLAADCGAQVVANHLPGLVLPMDVDSDGLGDVLIFEGIDVHVWFGRAAAPYFVAGPTTRVPHQRRACEPVIVGRYIWIASFQSQPGVRGAIDGWRILPDGVLVPYISYSVLPGGVGAEIASLRISPLAFDYGGDGINDILALWTEIPKSTSSSMRGAWFAPSTSSATFDFPPFATSMHHLQIVGLHPSKNIGQSVDDHLVVISAPPMTGQTGIAFAAIARGPIGPVYAGEVQFGAAPPARYRGPFDERARSVYGAFSPTPIFPGPVVQFVMGPSVAFDGLPSPPFVAPSGSWIDTSVSGMLLSNAVADFDGDGNDEIVLIDNLPGIGDVLVVTDPMPQSRDFQAYWYPSVPWQVANSYWPFEIVHGAPVDVNGDGLLDLALSARDSASTSRLSLYIGVRTPLQGRQVSLVRVL